MTIGADANVKTWRGLIAGDCFFDREEIRKLLQAGSERPWELVETRTSEAVLRAVLDAPNGPPDCLLLSDHLDDADIFGLLADLASPEGGCVCPVVVCSTDTDMEKAQAMLQAGAQDYFVKEWVSPSGLAWVIHNAMERWSMQRQLRDRATHLHLAMDASLAIAFEWDIIHDRVRRLQSAEDALPKTHDTWDTFEGVLRVVHPDDRELFQSNVHAAIHSADGKYHSEYRIVRPNGMVCWLGESGRVEFDLHGQPVRLIGISYEISERKRAEHALRQSEARFRALQQSTPDGFMLFKSLRDEAGTIIDFEWFYVNPAAERIVGRTNLAGKRLLVEMPGNREEGLFDAYVQVTETGEVWQHELHYCHEGMDRWFRTTATKTEDGFATSFIDITERKRAEEALAEQKRLYQSVTDNASVSLFIMDDRQQCVFMNPAAEKLTGYTRAETFGQSLHDVIHHTRPDGTPYPLCECPIDQAFPKNNREQGEETFVHKDGRFYDVAFTASPIRDAMGNSIGTVIEVQDITERKRAAALLEESESFYRQTIESIPAMTFTNSPDGACNYVSEQWVEYTGVPAIEHFGAGWLNVLHSEDRDRAYSAWTAAVNGLGQYDVEYRVRRHDGVYSWFKVQGRVIRDAEGAIIRWFGTAVNVDDLKQAEAALKRADRRKDEFLATLAHELRNPLAPIRTGLEVLKLRLHDPDALQICATMERQTRQLISLVDDLLEVSRITCGKLELRKCLVHLPDVLQIAVEASASVIRESGTHLSVNVPDASLVLEADPSRLAQVVSNLLTNAAKFTPEGGQIWLSAQGRGSEVAISVRDNGLGIPAEMQQRIFEMFAQIDDRPMEKGYRGLGIGLTLVKSLVEMHGGRIEVQSDGANTGSKFTVLLPIVIESTGKEEAPASPAEAPTSSRLRILVVDDNEDAAKMLAMMVRMLGHEVAIANDGQAGVTLAAQFMPALILMDIGMPRMNGYEAAHYIRQQPRGRKIVLAALTGWGQDEDKRRTKQAGFDYHLVKPVNARDLQQLFSAAAQHVVAPHLNEL